MSRDGLATLPRGATGMSAVCDCGDSLSYSLTIFGVCIASWGGGLGVAHAIFGLL